MKTPRTFSAVFLLFAAVNLHLRLIPTVSVRDPTTVSAISAAPTAAVAAAPAPNDSDFIRSSCQTTLYPTTCYNSLSGYASAVQQDPGRLARVAIGVSLATTKRASDYISTLSREPNTGIQPRASAALHDCYSVFGDAVDLIRDSMSQMLRLGGSGESLRFQMSNVQTWMSAALTNEDTCTDGFEGVPDGPLKRDVSDRACKVMEVTSNALALVNSFANKMPITP